MMSRILKVILERRRRERSDMIDRARLFIGQIESIPQFEPQCVRLRGAVTSSLE